MKEYILSLLPRLSQFSKGLNNSAILVDKPWIFLNEQGQQTKFVFRPNQELLVSINGAVERGRWEYLTAMDALLIEHGNQTQLFSQAFIDKGILVLNRDNTTELFVLINSNEIPDLDVVKYLGRLTHTEIEHPINREYKIGRLLNPYINLRIYPVREGVDDSTLGNRIKNIDGSKLEDGKYTMQVSTEIVVKNGEIIEAKNSLSSILTMASIILLYIC